MQVGDCSTEIAEASNKVFERKDNPIIKQEHCKKAACG